MNLMGMDYGEIWRGGVLVGRDGGLDDLGGFGSLEGREKEGVGGCFLYKGLGNETMRDKG